MRVKEYTGRRYRLQVLGPAVLENLSHQHGIFTVAGCLGSIDRDIPLA